MPSLSENLRLLRKGAGLTQKQLASRCRMAAITIRQYESGKREPRSPQLARLADALGVSAAELLLGTDVDCADPSRLSRDRKERLDAYQRALLPKGERLSADLLIMGEILVEIMREKEDVPFTQPGVFQGPYPSGAPAICASAAARLGCSTALIGCVGADDFGQFVTERLQADGVDCRCIQQDDGASTGCAFVTYSHDGSRKFIFHMGAAAHAAAPASEQLGPVRFMHIMGCSLSAGEQLAQGIRDTMRALLRSGTKISFDPNIRKELLHSDGTQEIFQDVLAHTSIFLPGREELLFLTGKEDIETAVQQCFENPALEILVLKDGARGCSLYTRNPAPENPDAASSAVTETFIRAYPVSQVDATGAGDCFDGAFLAGLIQGKAPEEAARMGSAAGALNAMAFGPMEGDLSAKKIDRFLAR